MNDLSSVPPKVIAIIVNWNSKADVLECLASLEQTTYPNVGVIVVDNGSTDGSVAAIHQQFPHVTVIENGANLGFGAACNIGMAQAIRDGADYFFLLNSDLKIDPAAIGELTALCEQNPQVGVAGPALYLYSDPSRIQNFGGTIELTKACVKENFAFQLDRGQLPSLQEVSFIGGGIMFLRRDVVEKVGGYDPIFFLYAEEVDLEIRAMRAGYKMVVVSSAKVWHKMYGAFGGKPNGRVKYNYFRSWAILGRRYLRGGGLLVFYFYFLVNRLCRFIAGCLVRRTFGLIEPAFCGASAGMRQKDIHLTTPVKTF